MRRTRICPASRSRSRFRMRVLVRMLPAGFASGRRMPKWPGHPGPARTLGNLGWRGKPVFAMIGFVRISPCRHKRTGIILGKSRTGADFGYCRPRCTLSVGGLPDALSPAGDGTVTIPAGKSSVAIRPAVAADSILWGTEGHRPDHEGRRRKFRVRRQRQPDRRRVYHLQ